jgi:hypothetical protein
MIALPPLVPIVQEPGAPAAHAALATVMESLS